MCIDCYRDARETGLTPSRLAVLKELAFHANHDRRAWPSISKIARYTGWSVSTVKRSLKFLRKHRLIHKDPGYRRRTRSVCYMIDRQTMQYFQERHELKLDMPRSRSRAL